jgi:serine/threonine-protein kinase
MLKPGDTFERYTVDAVLGKGGMGTVYRAHDTRLERRIALKVISEVDAGGDATARLLREARAAAALDHPNAVSIFDVGELDGAPYIAMELVSGRTLRESVGEGEGAPPVATRAGWLTDIARALAAAHRQGIVHRDIKPENVMVREDGVVKVLDFGIARRVGGNVDPSAPTQAPALPTLTKEGVKVGTPLYMAPEQIRGLALDGRVDQFAWGVLSYELLTGKLPWRGAGDALAVVASILTDRPDAAALTAAGVPTEAAAVVLRALSKEPGDRFASMDEAARALDAAMKGEAQSARSAPAPAGASASARPAAPATSATGMQRYSTEEVREILSHAIEQQESKRSDSRLGFEDLLAAAREVGVDQETLREASRDLRGRGDALAARADFEQWRRRKRRKFYTHLGSYLLVNLAFVIIAISNMDGGFLYPGLWWGIAVGMHGLRVFMADEDDFREERDKRDHKDRKERRRKEVVGRVIDEGASILMSTGAALRQRIQTPPTPPASAPAPTPARVRIAHETSSTAEAEAEAAAIAEQPEAKRRRS